MSRKHYLTAVIYDKKGRILSVGQNSYIKTHPIQKKYSAEAGCPEKEFLHAEVAAIIKCRDLSRAHRILISRFGLSGEPRLAKPCPACLIAIEAAGIKNISHT